MAQGVSQRSHTAVARIKSQASAYEICDGRSAIGIGYSPSTSFSAVSIIPPFLHNHLHIRVARKKTTGRRGFLKRCFLSRKQVTLERKVLQLGQFPSDLIRCATYIEVCGALNTTKATELEFLSYMGLYYYFSWNKMTRTVAYKK
jgi:hypothetical protein